LRRDEPWRVPTSELYLILRAGMSIPVEDHNAMLRDYYDSVAAAEDRQPLDQARVVLTGSFCEQPPLGLIKTLERAGCYIVDDDFVQILRWIRGDIVDGGDPLDALTHAFLGDSIDSPIRYDGSETKGQDIVRRVEEGKAEGVLFCAPSFCDPALLDQPMAQRALDAAGIPWTSLKYAENTGQFQVIREQAGTFADSIKLWSEA
jgi:benzoyl-CoA reductase subunit C